MSRAHSPSRRQVVHAYFVLPHAVPVLVVLGATAGFGLVAADGWPGTGAMLRLLGAMLGAQLAIGAVNELADAELDATAKPYKPIPAGLVSRRGAGILTGCGVSMMAVLSLTFGIAAFLLCMLGTLVGIAYSLWFKRTVWSWLPYLIALPLLPIWVWAALASVPGGMWAIYPIGAPAVIAVQLAQSLPDIAVDRETDVRTLAAILGSTAAQFACWGTLLLAAILATTLAPRLTDEPTLVSIAAAVAAGLVAVNAGIWLRNRPAGVMATFPCVALGAAALGIGWTAALVAT